MNQTPPPSPYCDFCGNYKDACDCSMGAIVKERDNLLSRLRQLEHELSECDKYAKGQYKGYDEKIRHLEAQNRRLKKALKSAKLALECGSDHKFDISQNTVDCVIDDIGIALKECAPEEGK